MRAMGPSSATVRIATLVLGLTLAVRPAGAAPPVSTDFDWTSIPLDTERGKTLGALGTRQAFVRSMRDLKPLKPCRVGWTPPADVELLHLEAELRIVSEVDSVTVVDAVVLESNPADAKIDRCYVENVRGTRHPAPGVEPGRRFRVQIGWYIPLK